MASDPAFLASFAGIPFNGLIPPNPVISAGPEHLLTLTNDVIRALTKDGATLSEATLTSFFASVTQPGDFITDPLTFFHAGRFFVGAVSSRGNPSGSFFLLAVSVSADPTGDWFFYAFDATLDNAIQTNNFADLPSMGVDDNALYFTANMFDADTFAFRGAKIRVIRKAPLLIGAPTTFFDFPEIRVGSTLVFHLQAAQSLSPSLAGFFISNQFPDECEVNVWRVVNPPSSDPLLFRQDFDVGGSCGFPPNAAQPGTTVRLETGGPRFINAVWRNNSLWTAAAVATNFGSGVVSSIRLFEVNTQGFPAISLTQDSIQGQDGVDRYYPTVGLDAAGNAIIAFNQSSPSEFASAYYASQPATAPRNTTLPTALFRAGEARYILRDSANRNRWGDYNGVAVDPASNAFWMVAEYAASPQDTWGTWVASVGFTADLFTPTVTASTTPTATETPTQTNTPTPTRSSTPSRSPTSTTTRSPTRTPTGTPSPTVTPTPSRTATATPSPTYTGSATPTETPTRTATVTHTATVTPTASITGTSTRTPTTSPTHTASPTISATPTLTPFPTRTSTRTLPPTPSLTPSPSPTASPSLTPTSTPSPTRTPTSTVTLTPTRTATPSPSHTATHTSTRTPTPTRTATPSITSTPTDTGTPTHTATPTETGTPGTNDCCQCPLPACGPPMDGTCARDCEPVFDAFCVSEVGACITRTPTATNTSTITPTPTNSATPTATPTNTATQTATSTSSYTSTRTGTETPTRTATRTSTLTATPTRTSTPTRTQTATHSPTSSITATTSPTRTPTSTPSRTATPSTTLTPTISPTPTVTSTPTTSPSTTTTPSPTDSPTEKATFTVSVTPTKTQTLTPTAPNTPTPTTSRTPTHTYTATATPRPADVDGNGVVNEIDLELTTGAIFEPAAPGINADVNRDGVVTAADLTAVILELD